MKVVIVGGVAGGATAAARIRRLDEKAEIVVFERSGFISYANCGLPYYIGGIIDKPGALTVQTPEGFHERFRVDVRVKHEVIELLPEEKCVRVKNLNTGEVFQESYDKLLLCPGAHPIRPAMPGLDSDRVFTLRTVEDTLRIREYIERERPHSAVLAGGGFISLETAENLREMGLEVSIVQKQLQLMNPFDPEMAAFIHGELRRSGIKLVLGHTVAGFAEENGRVKVLLQDCEPLEADFAVMAIGVAPESGLAKAAGLELGVRGSIAVNKRMETSVPDIYAAGDAVQVKNLITDEDTLIALAGPANKQGRIAADNICGGNSRYEGSLGTSVIKVFEMTAASVGINEGTAARAGLKTEKLYLSPMNHAGYYPGARMMTMKLLWEKESWRLLGAQIVGYEGVDKRIDVLAAVIQAKTDVRDLSELQLAYAPPYSSAKDPINMAGYMAENISLGLVKNFHWHDVDSLPRDGSIVLLDVRTEAEFARGRVEGFINIPVDELRERLDEIERGKDVYVMCQSGLRSYIASRILAQHGFNCFSLAGGFRLYNTAVRDAQAARVSMSCGME